MLCRNSNLSSASYKLSILSKSDLTFLSLSWFSHLSLLSVGIQVAYYSKLSTEGY